MTPLAPHRHLESDTAHGRDDFEEFYGQTSRPLWGYLRRISGDPSLAEDLHQETYLRYLRRPKRGAHEREKRAYLFQIATNLLRDRWRHKARWKGRLELFPEPTETPARDRQIDLRIDFEPVLSELQPRERALLWLAHVEGCPHREIAEILGLNAASVRVLLFRARKHLTEILESHGLEETTRLEEADRGIEP